MADCEECKKRLRILEGYRHPALGLRFPVCGKCFDKVDADMERWGKFCLSDSFTLEATPGDIQKAWITDLSCDPPLQSWFYDLWKKLEVTRRSSMNKNPLYQ
jgi:hypothetical protein